MARHKGSVLVDTNAIIECFRLGAWAALAGGYCVETVEDCFTETQTGFQRRSREQQIDPFELQSTLYAVHAVSTLALADVDLKVDGIALDIGERALWAHALQRPDAWVLCGPDRASMRFGVRLGLKDRLIALERLLSEAGFTPKHAYRTAFTAKWLNSTIGEMFILEGPGQA
jgi:hypothetical protein